MANRFINPVPSFWDSSGNILAGDSIGLCGLYSYITTTNTPAPTYSDPALTVENDNPVKLNARGEAETEIFLDPSIVYKFVLKDAEGVPIWTRDPVVDVAANVIATLRVVVGNPNGSVAGSAGTVGGSGASVVWDITSDLLYVCTASGPALTAVWSQVGGSLVGQVTQTGVISPAQIVANTDDWSPTGIETASVIRMSSDAARDLTGIVAQPEGTLLQIVNVGSFNITLKSENAGSTAANRLSLPGDIVLRPNAAVALRYDGTSSRWRPASKTEDNIPGLLFGLTLSNNSGDATNDIDIAAGKVRDSTDAVTMVYSASTTKRLDAGWAVGSAVGFRNSAIAIANATYHVYAVCKAGGGAADFYAHTSATIATMLTALHVETGGTDYIYARRIGSILREGAAIVAFRQSGDKFWRDIPTGDVNDTNPGTSAVTRTLKVPAGIVVDAVVTHGLQDTSTNTNMYGLLSALADTNSVPAIALRDVALRLVGADEAAAGTGYREVTTNTSAQIRSRISVSGAATIETITTLGWVDSRGRLA